MDRGTDGLIGNPEYRVRDKPGPGRIAPVGRVRLTDWAYALADDFSLKLLGNSHPVVPCGYGSR